jgi:hypothetical protein
MDPSNADPKTVWMRYGTNRKSMPQVIVSQIKEVRKAIPAVSFAASLV